MSEITKLHDGVKCCGVGCKAKDVCWRVQQPEMARQNWSMFEVNLGIDDDRCQFFLPLPNADLK